jgi:hypothetical protein
VGLGDEKLWLCPSINDSANDISGNGNNGVYQNGMTTVADTGSGGSFAYDFDGVSDYISIDITSAFTAGGSYSISFWAYDAVGLPYWNAYPSVSGGTRDQFVYIQNTGTRLLAGQANQSVSYQISNSFHTANQWTHVTVTHDSTSGMLTSYKNGVQFASTAQTISSSSPTLAEIGRVAVWNGGAAEYSQSLVDDIRAFGRALTQSEITHLATSRGIEGPAPVGLGDEQLWLCPSINDSANDISGNGNNGVYQNGMGTVADTSNGGSLAYDFDGTGDYISNSSLDLRNLSAFSYSAWIYDTKSTNSGSTMFSFGKYGSVSYPDDIFFFQSSLLQLQVNNGQDGSASVSTGSFKNSWHHVAVVFDGAGSGNSGRLRLFVDGVEVSLTYAYTVPASTSAISPFETRIGSYTGFPNTTYFQGKQDDVRVYTRAITQAEITHLATSRGIEGSPSTPTTHYNPFKSHAFNNDYTRRIR